MVHETNERIKEIKKRSKLKSNKNNPRLKTEADITTLYKKYSDADYYIT